MPRRWYEGRIVGISSLSDSDRTRQFFLDVDGIDDIDFLPGQFITVDLPIHEKRTQRWRSYSIANLPRQDGKIELCIVNLKGGLASEYLFHKLTLGDSITFKGPSGSFVLPTDPAFEKLVLVCTGTGIAPFRSMLLQLQRQGFDREVHLIFGTRTQDDILYREELTRLAQQEPNFTYTVTLSRDPKWDGPQGYVHKIYQEMYAEKDPGLMFMLCGWSMMVDEAVANLVAKMGYDPQQVKYELYG